MHIVSRRVILLLLVLTPLCWAQEPDGGEPQSDIAPDLRDSTLPAAARKGNFVAVPIPFSNPTLTAGIIGVAAFFHPQTEAQQKSQPASVTGLGLMYSSNKSYAAAVGHAGYWRDGRWRFKGALAYADVELPLLGLGENDGILDVDWLVSGSFLYSELSRRIGGRWYVGGSSRYVDVEQKFGIRLPSQEFALLDSFKTIGLGPNLTFDTRDKPINAYEGRYFRAAATFNRPSFGGDLSYASYSLAYSAYHTFPHALVVAWELSGCIKSDGVPLWDACAIRLRGFATTDYLGKSSVLGQIEARWKFDNRWGIVAFAGAGQINDSFSTLHEHELVPSYGAGLRWMVDTANRINVRLDYGRSTDADAVYLSVGEAF